MQKISKQFLKSYKEGKVVLFVGSGLSRKFGLPDWKSLVISMIGYIIEETGENSIEGLKNFLNDDKNSNPLQILDLIEKNYKKECLEYLSKSLKILSTEDFSLHKKLYKFCPRIITTNYDHGFELAIGDELNKINYESPYKLSSKNDEYLIKLHGDIDDVDKCILFKSDYERHYKHETAIIFELKKIISEKTILFLGFSYNDPYIKEVFSFINSLYQNFTPTNYILTTDENFSVDGIDKILLENYDDDLEKFIDLVLVEAEDIHVEGNSSLTINNQITIVDGKVNVNILFPDSVDKDYSFNIDQIQKAFKPYKVHVTVDFLSINNLRKIENGYVFIFTKTVKENLVIEDEYLRTRQISLNNLTEEITDKIDGLFICTNSLPKIIDKDITLPISIYTDESNSDRLIKEGLSSICHKLFKQNVVISENCHNLDKFKFYPYEKGTFTQEQNVPVISKNLDIKLLNNFIGRKTDVENIIRKLIDLEFENKILSIKGSGGIGKTTIISKAAIELARRNIFNEIHFISCQSISTYENFEYQISRCFKLDSSSNLRDKISENFHSKEFVIILDNFETLLNITESEQIISLVTFICDYSMIVTTTRQLLNLDFEEVYELRNMTPTEGTLLFKTYFKGKLNENETVFLRNEIVDELLNNNPLAIKLIAKGTLISKRMTDLRDELRKNIFQNDEIEMIFEKPEDINIEKSKSLYHSIKYSYDKLTDKERLTFELLSLFPDGIHFENFKIFSSKNTSQFKIGDKDIKSLDDKSLLENSNGFLKLQSIINRFSHYQFNKREVSEKKSYYTECYKYNKFFINLFSNNINFKSSSSLILHDQNLNNYLKCIQEIEFVDDTNDDLIYFINDVATVFRNINQSNDIIKVINEKINHFGENEQNKLALELIVLNLIYWTKEFNNSYEQLQSCVSLNDLNQYLKNNNDEDYDRVQSVIYTKACAVYECEGFTLEILKDRINKQIYYYDIDHLFYKLGFLKLACEIVEYEKDRMFFHYEILLANDKLNKETIEGYLKKLYKKETLEIIQTNYTKCKLLKDEYKEDANKFVITNPYTRGLMNLIKAFSTKSGVEEKKEFFLKALRDLKHIKYFHLEAYYYYSLFLKSINDMEYLTIIEEGIELTDKSNFYYLNYNFRLLKDENLPPYNEEEFIDKLGIDRSIIDEYLINHKKYILKN